MRTKYKAHDEKNQCRIGDRVVIVETRPLSRDKRWAVRSIVGRAPVSEIVLDARSAEGGA
jgi:small subunit ribosomal protein S17